MTNKQAIRNKVFLILAGFHKYGVKVSNIAGKAERISNIIIKLKK